MKKMNYTEVSYGLFNGIGLISNEVLYSNYQEPFAIDNDLRAESK